MKISKHLLFILVVFLLAIVVALAIKYRESLQQIWLWLVGFIGLIGTSFKKIVVGIRSFFETETNTNTGVGALVPANAAPEILSKAIDTPSTNEKPDMDTDASENKTVIDVLRYTDDGETTLGLLYIDNKFFCYTLEDTYRKVKIKGQTRIPAGSYTLDFIKQITPLTLTYRQTRDWFDFHLEIKNVPGFTGVYIHNGGTSADTEGCLLIADGITSNDSAKTLTNSRITFEEFYKLIGNRLRKNYKVTININDENWIDHLKN